MRIMAGMFLLALAASASASDLFKPAASLAKSSLAAFAKRESYVTMDWRALSSGNTAEAVAKSLTLNLFDDARFTAERTRLEWLGPGRFDWVGKIGDDDAIFSVRGGFLHGFAQHMGRVFEIESAGGDVYRVKEVDQAAFAALEWAHPNDVEGPVGDIPETPLLPGQPDPVIDVMVVYLREASSKITNMETFLASLFTLSNQAYVNSAIPQTIRLVHHQEVVSNIVGRENLNWMRNDPGIGALRDQYGADLVSMILETHDAAGTASGNFSIVTRSAAYGNKTFPHELGHNMGAQHAWEQFTNPQGYNYGYINHAKSWRTIMSYSACNAGGSCTRVNWFSNPDVLYNGDPAGIADSRDNARMMRSRSVSISNLRPTKVPPTALKPRVFVDAGYAIRGLSSRGMELRLSRGETLDITVSSLDGRMHRVARRHFAPGEHRLDWRTESLGPGVHFVQVRGQGKREVRKLPAF